MTGHGTALTGSPGKRRPHASKSCSQDENSKQSEEPSIQNSQASFLTLEGTSAVSLKKTIAALSISNLANQSGPKKPKIKHEPLASVETYPLDKLYAKRSEQQLPIQQHKADTMNLKLGTDDDEYYPTHLDHQSFSTSLPITPATENFGASTAATTRSASATPNDAQIQVEEYARLKAELAQAQTKISRLEAQTRTYSGPDSGRVTPALGLDMEFPQVMSGTASPTGPRGSAAPVLNINAGQARAPEPFLREQSWITQDDARSDTVDSIATHGIGRTMGLWNTNKPVFSNPFPQGSMTTDQVQWAPAASRAAYEQPASPFTPAIMDTYRQDRAPGDDMMRQMSRRSNRFDNRYNNSVGQLRGGFPNIPTGPYDHNQGYVTGPQNPMTGGMNMGLYPPYQQQAVGTPLSPHATEFTSVGAPWKSESINNEGQTYISATTEPLNYRRLLDRNVTCDWKYIVDKIVCNNDQQASIFLQQKLKVGTPEQKFDVVEAIVAQAYPLMINRFGNFLVQRCFEHGTPEQVINIAEAIRGNTLNLSMDPFGCHVVQKAFDSVPEDYKAIMVHELLRRIPDTVIHRYACHVWQKLFELRWTESPPQIMKYVNEALRGMWHEVALGETGSLVVQNIFENCLEEDKRPCIEEVLANIDIVAHGQFGNWCIQHICEHGAPADRSRAIDHVIRYAAEYSMDQFASKVVEKCLKIRGPEFLGRYLDRVCEGRVDRPRIPLIDIASDQYGNYLIQYILTHANPQHRDIVAAHIRKHMVSLRGSKFGSRVGMLCTNHAVATRPGPGVGPSTMGSRMGPGPRYGGAGYR
ncbi:meiotic coiled-coil protein 2 [Cladorrhinum sp. PSN332]|nr:meiotic coiled-coil protein 2 [Cladorrhinum sp. PSN332]